MIWAKLVFAIKNTDIQLIIFVTAVAWSQELMMCLNPRESNIGTNGFSKERASGSMRNTNLKVGTLGSK